MTAPDTQALREATARLDALLRELDGHADPDVRARLHEVVELLMAVHGAGLARILAFIADTAPGPPLVSRAADDPLVGPLLLAHDLHPHPPDVRVMRALERLRGQVAARGCRAGLDRIDDGAAHVRVEGADRVADADGLRQLIEAAVFDAAPELTRVVVVAAVPPAGGQAVPPPLLQITRRTGEVVPLVPAR